MRPLNFEEKRRALSTIAPSPIPYTNMDYSEFFKGFNDLAQVDYARGMLKHKKYCLVESIGTLELSIEKSMVSTTKLDELLLTMSLQAYKKSKKDIHAGNIIFSLPPFSFAFSLLLSYHLILSHISSSLSQDEDQKFSSDSGILIVTDNIELLSHIWRTTINDIQLRKFIPVYTIQSGNFKPFNFNEGKKEPKNEKRKFDGSLPWLTIFRAYRNQMPEQLDKKPEVIILDLMPFRHRKRAVELYNWAIKLAKHVIVITPSYDVINERFHSGLIKNHVPIDMATLAEFQNFFLMDLNIKNDPITSSWGTQTSIAHLHGNDAKLFKIYSNNIVNSDIIDSLKTVRMLWEKVRTSRGTYPTSFKLLHSTMLKMLSIVIPLEWYDRTKLSLGEATISEQLARFHNIQPEGHEEKIIYETLMPHFYQNILSLYKALKGQTMSPRGNGLIQILKKYLACDNNIIIIVSDDVDYYELGIWIRSLNIFKEDFLAKLEITSQSVWAKKQLNEIYTDSNDKQPIVLLLNPWKQKFISAFHFMEDTEVVMLDCFEELNLYRYQLKTIYSQGGIGKIWNTFQNLFSVSLGDVDRYKSVSLGTFVIDSIPINETTAEKRVSMTKGNVDIQGVFNDDILIRMFNEIDDDILDSEMEDTNWERDVAVVLETEELQQSFEYQDSIEVGVKNSTGDEYVVFLPTDTYIKVKRFNKEEIESVSPYELKLNDIWVRVRENKRKELFNEILGFASNTLVMKWIYTNVDEWKLMINRVWQKFYSPDKYKKHIYEAIKQEVNANGGNVESHLTISNWINGDVQLVRDFNNIVALAKILNDERFLKRAQSIFGAMKELWGIHVKLGRSLGKIINQQAMSISLGNSEDNGQWINLGNDLIIPIDDVINAINLLIIKDIQFDNIYQVHPKLLEKNLLHDDCEKFKKRGLIRNDC